MKSIMTIFLCAILCTCCHLNNSAQEIPTTDPSTGEPVETQCRFSSDHGDASFEVECNKGWFFYGWGVDKDGNGSFEYGKDIILSLDRDYVVGLSPIGGLYPDLESAQNNMPSVEGPKDHFFALFTASKAVFADGQSVGGLGTYGSIKVDKPLNSIGDTLTFTALPFEGRKFVSWTDQDGKTVSRSAEYKTTITEPLCLTANFE